MSVRSWRWTSLRLPRNPRIAERVLLKRANLSFVLMYVMTDAYGSLRFSAIFSASFLFTLLHSGAIPPVVVKTQGDWMKTSLCQSLFDCIYPFHVVGRSLPGTSQNMIVRQDVWSLCQRKFSHSYSTVLSQRYPTLHCQQCWLFFDNHFHWLVEVWIRSEYPYRPLLYKMDCWTNSLIAMHSFDFGDICKCNGASSQELNRGYKLFL